MLLLSSDMWITYVLTIYTHNYKTKIFNYPNETHGQKCGVFLLLHLQGLKYEL